MLHQGDHGSIDAIERQLRIDDPVFVERFDEKQQQLGDKELPSSVRVTALIVALLIAFVAFSVLGAIALIIVAAVVGLLLTTAHSLRRGLGENDPTFFHNDWRQL